MKSPENNVAVITGASMGIGLETAKLFAEQGAKVIVAGCNEKGGKTSLKSLGIKRDRYYSPNEPDRQEPAGLIFGI